jgi:hypothetical protein
MMVIPERRRTHRNRYLRLRNIYFWQDINIVCLCSVYLVAHNPRLYSNTLLFSSSREREVLGRGIAK